MNTTTTTNTSASAKVGAIIIGAFGAVIIGALALAPAAATLPVWAKVAGLVSGLWLVGEAVNGLRQR